jgi:diguanylate cyclase (GGDEF)-like protein/PAS domain S-box-containing protein
VTLHKRTLIIICIAFLGLIAALYATSQGIVLGGFARQEESDARRDVERVKSALVDNLATLEGTTRDWAYWDDTYAYIEDENEAYVKSNLVPDTGMQANRLSVMAFVHSTGRLVYGRGYDLHEGQPIPLPESLRAHLAPNSPLLSPMQNPNVVTGILSLPEGPMLVASVPILTSDATGPPRGTLIFGRYLDTAEIAHLARTTLSSLTAYPVTASTLPADYQEALSLLQGDGSVTIRPGSSDSTAGYVLLHDIYGKPAIILRAVIPRGIYAEGQATVLYLTVALAIIGLAFGVAIVILLDRVLLSRLARLRHNVSAITASGDLSTRLEVTEKDDLSSLATDINGMLEALDASQKDRKASESRYRVLTEQTSDGIAVYDFDGNIIQANPRACEMLGYSLEEMLAMNLRDIIDPDDMARNPIRFDELVNGKIVLSERLLRRKDGTLLPTEVSAKLLTAQNGVHAIVRDITERLDLQEQLSHQAFHDALTGLSNRALFMDRLAQAIARSSRHDDAIAVLFLDLDDFKVINDSLGHKAGDHLLIEMAERLQRCVRKGDTVARLGGDEFTVLVEETKGPYGAEYVAARIAEELQRPFNLDGHEVFVTTSIGIALSGPDASEPDDLLRDADVAMYEAKNQGKSRYAIFDVAMNTRAWKRLELEIEMRRALERGDFSVFYQPVVRLDTGRIVEVEALARWNHRSGRLIAPVEFIPVAEETGLILHLGRWILQEACQQVRAWQLAHPTDPPLMLSVNLSTRQLKHPQLIEDIMSDLEGADFDPTCLKLEITESVALDDREATIAALHELRRLGIHLAIDDFGTGYSALGYLKRLPVDTLKIDRSFVDGLGRDLEDTAIVRAVVAFAKTLSLTVTAEGIERSEQLHHLRELGCECGQGFFFSRPLPCYEMEEMLAGHALPMPALAEPVAV